METIKPIYNPGNACYVISAYHVFNSIKEFCENNEFFISALENVYTSGDITTFCDIIDADYNKKDDSLLTIDKIIKSFGLNCVVNYCRPDQKYSIKKDNKVLMFAYEFDDVPGTFIKDGYEYKLASAVYYCPGHYIALRHIKGNKYIILDDKDKSDYYGLVNEGDNVAISNHTDVVEGTINVDKIDDGIKKERVFKLRLACYKRTGCFSQ